MEEDIDKNGNIIARCVICGEIISGNTFEEFEINLREHVKKHKLKGEIS